LCSGAFRNSCQQQRRSSSRLGCCRTAAHRCFLSLSFRLQSVIAEIIAVGSELLTPFRQDTNSLYLTSQLNELGVEVAFKTIVGDNLKHIVRATTTALSRAEIILLSGGLGPTEDDLTREAVAQTLGLHLKRDAEVLQGIEARFAAHGWKMSPNNAKQADVISGATVLT